MKLELKHDSEVFYCLFLRNEFFTEEVPGGFIIYDSWREGQISRNLWS